MLPRFRILLGLWAVVAVFIQTALGAPVHELVYGFPTALQNPYNGLTLGPDGWYWGTTYAGGVYGKGAVFKVKPDGTDWSPVFSFYIYNTVVNGERPWAALTNDGAGNLWGTTSAGGTNNYGTVFKVNAATGVLTTVVQFTLNGATNKGGYPYGQLVGDGAGNLWGTTTIGGANSVGTIYKVNLATGLLTTVVNFSDNGASNKGSYPYAELVSDGAGNFWGTTSAGGASSFGTVFKVNTSTGALTTVVEFTFGTPKVGNDPEGGLVSDGAGFFWGSTKKAGAANVGTIFKVNQTTGALTTVLEFTGNGAINKGNGPRGTLVSDGTGFLWGTTGGGGANGYGTVFKINVSSGALTTVVELNNLGPANKGSGPGGNLLGDGSGNFWGTTVSGGIDDNGTVFRLNAATGALTTLVEFGEKGKFPQAALADDGMGMLWSTTNSGGSYFAGTVFKVNPLTGEQSTVLQFTGNGATNKGYNPYAGLYNDGAGTFWGTASTGGASNLGTIFKINIATGALTTPIEFTGTGGSNTGSNPKADLVSDGGSFLWGSTAAGGTPGHGTLFKIDRVSGVLSTVIQFNNLGPANKGKAPIAAMVSGGAGFLIGTTSQGGANSRGTVFKENTSTGAILTLAEFSGSSAPKGSEPSGTLLSDGAGSYWGTTYGGGAGDLGTVFKVNATTGAVTTVIQFTGNGATNKGSHPKAGLTKDPAGTLWGTTWQGGAIDTGTIFKINPATNVLTTVIEFTDNGDQANAGSGPAYGALYAHTDGNLYGTTAGGGPGAAGTVFRLRFGPTPLTLPATGPGTTAATLTGSLNPNGTSTAAVFEWGTAANALTNTATISGGPFTGSTATAVSATLASLTPNTTYYFRLRGDNADQFQAQRGAVLSFTTLPNPDADGDGLPDAWEIAKWGTTTGHAALDDFDHDGFVELLEYAFDLDPKTPDRAALPAPTIEGGYLTITLTKRPGVTFTVQTAGDLAAVSWDTAGTTILTDTATTLKVRDNFLLSSGGTRYLRVRVTAP